MTKGKRLIWDVDVKSAYRAWLNTKDDYRSMEEVIDNIPTEDAAEVVHGCWEVVEPKKFPNETARIRCSACKKEPKKHTYHDQGHGYSFDVDSWDATDYCPSCGAKMDKNENQ